MSGQGRALPQLQMGMAVEGVRPAVILAAVISVRLSSFTDI
jgi:hypothetical protein